MACTCWLGTCCCLWIKGKWIWGGCLLQGARTVIHLDEASLHQALHSLQPHGNPSSSRHPRAISNVTVRKSFLLQHHGSPFLLWGNSQIGLPQVPKCSQSSPPSLPSHLRHLSRQAPVRKTVSHQSCGSLMDPPQSPQVLTFPNGPEGGCRQQEVDSK